MDTAIATSDRFRADGHTLIASWVLTGPANMAACSFTAGMLAIVLSLMLYVALAAANFGRDNNDQLVAMWVQDYYWLLLAETAFIITSVLFVWACAYFVGLIKSEVNCACPAVPPPHSGVRLCQLACRRQATSAIPLRLRRSIARRAACFMQHKCVLVAGRP